jgi:hypothetical protein
VKSVVLGPGHCAGYPFSSLLVMPPLTRHSRRDLQSPLPVHLHHLSTCNPAVAHGACSLVTLSLSHSARVTAS